MLIIVLKNKEQNGTVMGQWGQNQCDFDSLITLEFQYLVTL